MKAYINYMGEKAILDNVKEHLNEINTTADLEASCAIEAYSLRIVSSYKLPEIKDKILKQKIYELCLEDEEIIMHLF